MGVVYQSRVAAHALSVGTRAGRRSEPFEYDRALESLTIAAALD